MGNARKCGEDLGNLKSRDPEASSTAADDEEQHAWRYDGPMNGYHMAKAGSIYSREQCDTTIHQGRSAVIFITSAYSGVGKLIGTHVRAARAHVSVNQSYNCGSIEMSKGKGPVIGDFLRALSSGFSSCSLL
ncbi:hypothetical protein Scep_007834 [Stephania cephalantha]|uniref:Uncharacterized protein n=1 Tax=Stephania cephalantha TaxID=152367 RepID=A0AAP0PM58_9MAGN